MDDIRDAGGHALALDARLPAIEAGRPETRYAVGYMAERLLELNRTLPDREFDKLLTNVAK
ncbi:hypothetical protein ABT120_00055 [Nonomuraea angiospora]|uniref:hypothetical protein n=1 Tax=Nonomuraea angiospora TaxID=46172 RepID=UPI003326B285